MLGPAMKSFFQFCHVQCHPVVTDAFVKAICKDSGYSQIYTDLLPFVAISIFEVDTGFPVCQTFAHTGFTYELVYIHLSQDTHSQTYSAYQFYKVYDHCKIPIKYSVLQTLKSFDLALPPRIGTHRGNLGVNEGDRQIFMMTEQADLTTTAFAGRVLVRIAFGK